MNEIGVRIDVRREGEALNGLESKDTRVRSGGEARLHLPKISSATKADTYIET